MGRASQREADGKQRHHFRGSLLIPRGALECTLYLRVGPTFQQRRLVFVRGAILVGGEGSLHIQEGTSLFKDKEGRYQGAIG